MAGSLALVAALTLAGCHPLPRAARPPLWRVDAPGGGRLWVIGSIHLLPRGTEWRTLLVTRALAESTAIVLEVPPADPAADARAWYAIAPAPAAVPIAARVPARDRDALAQAAVRAGASLHLLDGLKSWAAALVIGAGAARAAGADDGVEAALARDAARSHRPLLALETLPGQLAAFDALPESAQRRLLADAVTDRDGYRRELSAWARGDLVALARDLPPEPARHLLVTDRSRRWAALLAARLRGRGTGFVAVGSGHLIGREGLPALLAAHGLRVTRVE